MEVGDRIRRNFFDRNPNSRFIPAVLDKRTMTSRGNHGVRAPERCPSILQLRQQDCTIERKLSGSVPRGKPTAPSETVQRGAAPNQYKQRSANAGGVPRSWTTVDWGHSALDQRCTPSVDGRCSPQGGAGYQFYALSP